MHYWHGRRSVHTVHNVHFGTYFYLFTRCLLAFTNYPRVLVPHKGGPMWEEALDKILIMEQGILSRGHSAIQHDLM